MIIEYVIDDDEFFFSVQELAVASSLDSVDFHPLRHSAHQLQVASVKLDGEKSAAEVDFKKKLANLPKGSGKHSCSTSRVVRWVKRFINHMLMRDDPIKEFIKAAKRVQAANAKLVAFEKGFIHEDGIKDREWYRHLGVAPGKWLGALIFSFFFVRCGPTDFIMMSMF